MLDETEGKVSCCGLELEELGLVVGLWLDIILEIV
jgi:hypothetical protein